MNVTSESIVVVPYPLFFEKKGNMTLVVLPITGGYYVFESGIHPGLEILKLLEPKNRVTMISVAHSIGLELNETVNHVIFLFKKGLIALDGILLGTSSSRSPDVNITIHHPLPSNTTIYPTLCIFHVHNYCNLGCKYCYTIEEGVNRQQLSIEIMKKAIDEFTHLPTARTLFEFHGGEPLMAFKNIIAATEYAHEVYALKDKKVSFSIQTNAYSISNRIAAFLKKYNFSARVSLDGTEETHNQS